MALLSPQSRSVLAATLLLSPVAGAFSIQQTPLNYTVRWSTLPIAFHVTSIGSDDVSGDSDLEAISASFADWEDVECSKLVFEQAGPTTVDSVIATGAEPNGKNEVVFIEDSTWSFGQYVLGITSPLNYVDGTTHEADIGFNGFSSSWSTDGKKDTSDIKSVAIHEIGHAFGLQHNLNSEADEPPTMAPTADPYGRTASLEQDDRLGACFLYPSGAGYACTGDAGCPYVLDVDQDSGKEYYTTKLVCLSKVCQYDTGGGTKATLGEACAKPADCAAPFFCQPLEGTQVCSQYCYTDFPSCPQGYDCFPYQDDNLGACLASTEPPKKANGALCSVADECESGTCFETSSGRYCEPPCTGDGPCAAGTTCYTAPGTTKGACLPESLLPLTATPNGFPCSADDDCNTKLCRANPGTPGPNFCRGLCGADNACDEKFACVKVEGPFICIPEEAVPVDVPEPAPIAPDESQTVEEVAGEEDVSGGTASTEDVKSTSKSGGRSGGCASAAGPSGGRVLVLAFALLWLLRSRQSGARRPFTRPSHPGL